MLHEFNWTAGDQPTDDEAAREYFGQAESLAVALMVNRQATIMLGDFIGLRSDHERIAACRRAFRAAARSVPGSKVRTLMLRDDEGDPAAVMGYIDEPATPEDLRRAVGWPDS
jgi:hypothetical protein